MISLRTLLCNLLCPVTLTKKHEVTLPVPPSLLKTRSGRNCAVSLHYWFTGRRNTRLLRLSWRSRMLEIASQNSAFQGFNWIHKNGDNVFRIFSFLLNTCNQCSLDKIIFAWISAVSICCTKLSMFIQFPADFLLSVCCYIKSTLPFAGSLAADSPNHRLKILRKNCVWTCTDIFLWASFPK